ncbi:Copper(I)-binding protein [Lentzea albidocapillata subsp. violacea]|uniref:Copper(I)-binding protein n=1 Tax=Lentzea albidocapillata subsp. violacea TaxID=128104 RepID=A0A1G8YPB5_9PSEU|nr:copper chaperone PCu(A)C [Lentzea albidocapillata]SDK04577.1 Copper(I)-binding protein [Lentzea albidocapillata subsp. violacea]
MRLLTALVVPLMFGLASCGEPQRVLRSGTVGANGEVGQVLLRNIHMTPPGGDGYEAGDDAVVQLLIFNQARETDTLVDVRSDAAKDIVMRWDEQCDGEAERVERLPLLADGGVARLSGAMGAYHFEFVDLTRKLWAGNDVAVTFEFERAGSVTLDVPVEVETGTTGLRHPQRCPASTVKGEFR